MLLHQVFQLGSGEFGPIALLQELLGHVAGRQFTEEPAQCLVLAAPEATGTYRRQVALKEDAVPGEVDLKPKSPCSGALQLEADMPGLGFLSRVIQLRDLMVGQSLLSEVHAHSLARKAEHHKAVVLVNLSSQVGPQGWSHAPQEIEQLHRVLRVLHGGVCPVPRPPQKVSDAVKAGALEAEWEQVLVGERHGVDLLVRDASLDTMLLERCLDHVLVKADVVAADRVRTLGECHDPWSGFRHRGGSVPP